MEKKLKIKNTNAPLLQNLPKLLKIIIKYKGHVGGLKKHSNAVTQSYVKNLRFNQNIIDVKTMLFNLQTTFKFLDHLLKQNKKLNIVMFCDKYSEEVMKKLAIELDNCGIKLVTGTPKTGFLYYKENLGIDLIISTNSSQNFDIFREALSFRIPVVGLCSTSVNSHLITYPIVSNTQDPKSILLFVTLFKQFFNQLKIKK